MIFLVPEVLGAGGTGGGCTAVDTCMPVKTRHVLAKAPVWLRWAKVGGTGGGAGAPGV